MVVAILQGQKCLELVNCFYEENKQKRRTVQEYNATSPIPDVRNEMNSSFDSIIIQPQ